MLVKLEDLSKALADDQVVPYFQPIVELRTGRLSGLEVLARWNHPTQGAVLPSNLIEMAEGNRLIGEVTRQVFTKAFTLVATLPEQPRLSVNLSPIQLSYPNLAEQVEQMASTAGFPLDRLTVEITESALLSDLVQSRRLAHELKETGCRLSLDDFGTGYSSLAHLHALPFDELKIDRSFVSQMTKKRESRKIVAAIIGLGHSLGLTTVAEGIEDEEQADMLLWLGSELGQGWHYGRPEPVESVHTMLRTATPPAIAELPSPGDDWSVSSLEAFPTQRLAQLQAIYDGAPVGLCFLDCNLRYISLNQRLAELNNGTVAGHLGKTVAEVIPELYPHIEPHLLRALKGEAVSGVEVYRPRPKPAKDGWLLNSYQPAFDEADEVIGISISVMDITDQKRAKDELQESEFMQRQLIDLNRLEPWVMDSEGNNLQMSSKWVTLDPNARHRARNLGWLEALHVDDLQSAFSKIKHALRTGERIDMEYRIQNTEGEWRWMRSRGMPRFGPDGTITRWYGSVEDIHEKRCAEEAARETELKIRSLLAAVPEGVCIKEEIKQVLKADARPVRDHAPARAAHGACAADHRPPGTKVEIQNKNTPLAIGLQTVVDAVAAHSERERQVAMLEQFAEQRAQK